MNTQQTVPASPLHEAVVIIHTRREQCCSVEYQTVYDLLWSVNNRLCKRRVPCTVIMQSGIFFISRDELIMKGGMV